MQNLEDIVLEDLGREMADHIDSEVILGLLQGLGWFYIELEKFTDNHHAVDIRYWIESNIKNSFHQSGRKFVFEDQGDAVNFSLKWA